MHRDFNKQGRRATAKVESLISLCVSLIFLAKSSLEFCDIPLKKTRMGCDVVGGGCEVSGEC